MEAIDLNDNNGAFNVEVCVFCQKHGGKLVKVTEKGRIAINAASLSRKDEVSERLAIVGKEEYYYHSTNQCYKAYTNKTNIDGLIRKRKRESNSCSDSNAAAGSSGTNDSVKPRKSSRGNNSRSAANPEGTDILYKQKCIICDHYSHKKDFNKSRICESDRANIFQKATFYFQDEVYTRTCDLQDEGRIYGADLYYHKVCLQNYISRYNVAFQNKPSTPKLNEKQTIWKEALALLEKGLTDGKGYELSAIRDYLNSKITEDTSPFYNKDIKLYLQNHFGKSIDFAYPDASQKCLMVFSVAQNKASDLAEKIRSIDSMQVCASAIRKELLNFDFYLNDKFCDAVDLRDSLYNFQIPQMTLKFFSKVFNFEPESHHEVSKQIIRESCDYESDEDEDDDSKKSSRKVSKSRCRKVQSLFQSMFYVLHCGRKRTPMHLMNGIWAQSLGDGGSMFTRILNNLGLASSYQEVLRYQYDMAAFSVKNQNDRALIPSHFQKDQFTSGAMDNWDHEGERVSVHDTVAVLYQDSSPVNTYKPNISEAGVVHGPQAFDTKLHCQQLLEFFKPPNRPDFPSDVTIEPDIYTYDDDDEKYLLKMDMAWSLSRLNLQSLISGNTSGMLYPDEQAMPSWKAYNALITNEQVPVKRTAFLPVLPYPCTEYSTVYTAMKNFVSICTELEQEKIPIYCDEKVYCIVKEIQFLRQKEFECIIPCLGSFHTMKTLLKCIGKSLRGTGVETLFLDAAGYGPSIVDGSILGGKHYNRSLEAFSLLSESLIRVLYKEFFSSYPIEKYGPEIESLSLLKLHVSQMDSEKSKLDLSEFCTNAEELLNDFKSFVIERKNSNENFSYWIAFLNKMQVVFDLLRADREGNWELHLDAIQRSLYEFAAWDSFNYLRWGSIYLEEMRLLRDTCPLVYEHFSKGSFSIKTNEGKFTAVGGDQKLEQTINLASKKSNSVIYNSKNRNLVAKWDLIYHEILAVKSLHSRYSSAVDSSFEGFQHHESSKAFTDKLEGQVQSVIRFIEGKGSPLSESAPKTLQNFVSKQIMPETIRKDLLKSSDIGKEKYLEFRSKRLLQKSERISATIHKMNLSNMSTANSSAPVKTTKQVVKEISLNERKIEIARDRGVTADILLQHDLSDSTVLYDGNHLTKAKKSELTTELEKQHLDAEDYRYGAHGSSDLECAFVVDVMANLRKIPSKELLTFGELVSQFLANFNSSLKKGRLNIVFDLYHDEPSVKDCERLRRQDSAPVNLSEVKDLTPLPRDLKTFWPSNSNKCLLEKLVYTSISNLNSSYPVMIGQLSPDDEEWQCVAIDGDSPFVPYMTTQPYLDEADLQIVLYVLDSVKCSFPRVTVFSNDTDVLVTLIYHMPVFLQNGLRELWVKGGVGDSTRYIPAHTLYEKLGAEFCSILPALHSLTGCDITSKVGTKKAAVNSNPVQFLRSFGKHPVLTESDISEAERFLCKVLQKNNDCKNFNELRVHLYNFSTDKTHWNLPPTSIALLPHIKRSFYNTYSLTHIIEGQYAPINPELHGFGMIDSLLLPVRAKNELDDSWTTKCKCTNCSRSSCPCRSAKVGCVRFCGCKKRGDCKNPL